MLRSDRGWRVIGTSIWFMEKPWPSWGEGGFHQDGEDIADEEGLCGLPEQPSTAARLKGHADLNVCS
ncbi:hypothetical protein PR202_ga30362 [Eleusine coracana subsp. coracana]|uniref:Uncharacterized protein n=1 Tax=Eleusine coracana subsp. coracana TaxID=191504 RepID=A0AAV5DPL0_ELECO|nr:hypothetical protein PR202_ga30362 [Eleusine coracana subsp. coracana]